MTRRRSRARGWAGPRPRPPRRQPPGRRPTAANRACPCRSAPATRRDLCGDRSTRVTLACYAHAAQTPVLKLGFPTLFLWVFTPNLIWRTASFISSSSLPTPVHWLLNLSCIHQLTLHWGFNPTHYRRLNSSLNWRLNPFLRWGFNPSLDWGFNPSYYWGFKPFHHWEFNPSLDWGTEPCLMWSSVLSLQRE